MMSGNPTAEHLDELRPEHFQPAGGEIDQSLRIRFAGHKRLENRRPQVPRMSRMVSVSFTFASSRAF
jgi:hypothetical protein